MVFQSSSSLAPKRFFGKFSSSSSSSSLPVTNGTSTTTARMSPAMIMLVFFLLVLLTHLIMTYVSTTPNSQSTSVLRTSKKFCDGSTTCIFDVGHNTGQDTVNYLRDASTKVVAVDANPQLMNTSRVTFQNAVEVGRLELVTVGLVGLDAKPGEKLSFWVNTRNDKFSSFRQYTGCRGPWGQRMEDGDTTYCKEIHVPTQTCAWLVKHYGTPDYMKIDIEGLDEVCVDALKEVGLKHRPKYISVENVNKMKVELLESLGYNGFKAVVQNDFDKVSDESRLNGHSGPWGEAATDVELGQKWSGKDEIIARIPLPGANAAAGSEEKRWYDLHAVRQI